MREIKSIFELKEFLEDYEELKKIAKKLQRYNEIFCERSLTRREWKRKEELEKKAKEITGKWNMEVDIQQDPRIAPLVILDDEVFYREQGIVIPLK